MDSRETEAIDANASPRKPMLATCVRSSKLAILLVACGASASSNSSAGIPAPSSRTRIRRMPPCSTSMSMRCAPASRLFSANSFTTDAGRSMTSPAAIWLTSSGGSGRMADIVRSIADAGMPIARKARATQRQSGLPGLDDPVARHVLAARQFHALLRHETLQQHVECAHEFRVAVDLIGTVLFDLPHALFLDVARDDAGERAAHVGRQFVRRAAAMQVQRRHRRMGRLEMLLERQIDVQFPVEEERVVLLDAMVAHHFDALLDRVRHRHRILDDDLVALRRSVAQHQAQELVDL